MESNEKDLDSTKIRCREAHARLRDNLIATQERQTHHAGGKEMKFVVGDACIRLLLRSANHRVVFKLTASRDSHPQFRERVFAVFEGGPPRIMSFPNYTYLRPHHTTLFFYFLQHFPAN